ncbi:hypothetical protein CENSYa_1011 [Cenarchaeum symbiosum A]|uniref:Uncharacterized protein n=1 Tax=Cenarchaeum symbiosum (strain A) TaxID=414004 RepID=A0RWC6_CENSY|nr:hypothetical protein CENSYa_1011 [Cenarchaeum symbiosum A]
MTQIQAISATHLPDFSRVVIQAGRVPGHNGEPPVRSFPQYKAVFGLLVCHPTVTIMPPDICKCIAPRTYIKPRDIPALR